MTMKTMTKTILLAGAAMAMAMATSAGAATAIFNFGTSGTKNTLNLYTGDLGQTSTFVTNGISITMAAFGPAFNGADRLYGKSQGGDEVGLGMTNDLANQNEIYNQQGYIQLDAGWNGANIVANFNSTTGNEQWLIYGSSVGGTVASSTVLPVGFQLIGSGSGANAETTNTQLTGYRYYEFVSGVPASSLGGGNVLLRSLTVSVPEPDTWALMIVGFGGLGAMMRRRRAQVAAATA
jgi:hypothetical protein